VPEALGKLFNMVQVSKRSVQMPIYLDLHLGVSLKILKRQIQVLHIEFNKTSHWYTCIVIIFYFRLNIIQ